MTVPKGKCYGGGGERIPEGNPALVWEAFQHVVRAWRRERASVRLIGRYATTVGSPVLHLGVDGAPDVVTHDDTGYALPLEPGTLPRSMACALALATTIHEFVVHDPEALVKVAAYIDRAQAESRRRQRRSPVSEAGAVLVQIAEASAPHEVVGRLAAAVRALPELGCPLPSTAAIARADRAARKQERNHPEGEATPRRRAQAVVQHVLASFGMSRDSAKNAVGLRKK